MSDAVAEASPEGGGPRPRCASVCAGRPRWARPEQPTPRRRTSPALDSGQRAMKWNTGSADHEGHGFRTSLSFHRRGKPTNGTCSPGTPSSLQSHANSSCLVGHLALCVCRESLSLKHLRRDFKVARKVAWPPSPNVPKRLQLSSDGPARDTGGDSFQGGVVASWNG